MPRLFPAAFLAVALLLSACHDGADPLGPDPRPTRLFAAPGVHVVNTLDDVVDGGGCTADHCSLREAVAAAQDGETVQFSVTGVVQLTQPGLPLQRSITVSGPGAGLLTVRGAATFANFGVFQVHPGATVELSGLRLTGGRGAFGSAVFNRGTATLVGLVVEDNEAIRGGGLVNLGDMTLVGSVVRGNRAEDGGGILNRGALVVRESVIAANRAEAPTVFTGAWGGGILNDGSLEVRDSRIEGNRASGTAAVFGGGVVNFGEGRATFVGTAVRDNDADAEGGTARGGGIYNGGLLTLRDAEISGNRAVGSFAYGGGLNADANGESALDNVIVRGNRVEAGVAFADGSAVLSQGALRIRHATVLGNEAVENGVFEASAIVALGPFTLLNSLVADNPATDGPSELFYFLNNPDRDVRGNVLGRVRPWLEAELAADNLVDVPLVPGGGFVNFGFLEGPDVGPVEAYRVVEGSVVVDRGVVDGCVPVDLLGNARPDGAACDAGAVEFVPGQLEGFVTGGGWIDSAPGAYRADPSLGGKATFGFVARHRKGATVPEGQTRFVFQAAGMSFKATEYEWLLVAGSRARFKGVGEIEGRPGRFTFLLTAEDGDPDTFRLQIVDPLADAVVYDNGVHQPLGGGSIVVHRR